MLYQVQVSVTVCMYTIDVYNQTVQTPGGKEVNWFSVNDQGWWFPKLQLLQYYLHLYALVLSVQMFHFPFWKSLKLWKCPCLLLIALYQQLMRYKKLFTSFNFCGGHYQSQQHSRASLWEPSKPLKVRWSCRTSILVPYTGLLWQLLTVTFVLWVNHALLSYIIQLLSTLPFALETSSFAATGSMWTWWAKFTVQRMSWIP